MFVGNNFIRLLKKTTKKHTRVSLKKMLVKTEIARQETKQAAEMFEKLAATSLHEV